MIFEFLESFKSFNEKTVNETLKFYSKQAEFRDPYTQLKGRNEIDAHFKKLAKRVENCEFQYFSIVDNKEGMAFASWLMTLKVKSKLVPEIKLFGASELHYDEGFISYHRDYFDTKDLVTSLTPGWNQIKKILTR